MNDFFTGGKIGELFVALSFACAAIAAISYFIANKKPGGEKSGWEALGKYSFLIHGISVAGIFTTLFVLIATHQYQYNYVWAHSSNELPVYYMISCFWEGQEGSFLLWQFWHSVLGAILIFRGGEWRNIVISVIASVELILSSMVLGIFLNEAVVKFLLAGALFAAGFYLLLGFRQIRLQTLSMEPETKNKAGNGLFQLSGAIFAMLLTALLLRGNSGFGSGQFEADGAFSSVAFAFFLLFGLVFVLLFLQSVYHRLSANDRLRSSGTEMLSAGFVLACGIVLALSETGAWKLGSTPFLTLKAAFPGNAIYQLDPDFVPANGSGLNSLLQNYWMVIHPPTLFLGFASTVVPFAFVIGALLNGKYTEWIRPATPWTIFSVMILGIGIIMGGYWAYETLNFGGYWNWDAVENASLVPWLIGIGSIHSMISFRNSKMFLKLTMGMVIATFILVLYSTFLTRSGILGETSVHTFTDLGLSGQLLVLLFAYFFSVILLFVVRWNDIPVISKNIHFWSKDFFLFAAVLVFVFTSIGITISTSLPVINKIFGTNLAAPAALQFFYFRWNVWFAVLIGVLSGIGQFLYWKKVERKDLGNAIFRPFLIAILLASAIIVLLAFSTMQFSFEGEYRAWLQEAETMEGFTGKISRYFQFGLFIFADEILLASALFSVFANLDIIIQLSRKKEKLFRVTGGSIAHVGFGLMLVGILFSSGYDTIVSTNFSPGDLQFFEREQDRKDNVMLHPMVPKIINGYQVTYVGKKEALPPVSDIEIIEERDREIKVRFRDSRGETYADWMPRDNFLVMNNGFLLPDTGFIRLFLNETVAFARPPHANGRSFYGLLFQTLVMEKDTIIVSGDPFLLYPESEINGQSIISHPARKIFADRDLYVHVSSLPSNSEFKPEYEEMEVVLAKGDTVKEGEFSFYLKDVALLDSNETWSLQARAVIEVFAGDTSFIAEPVIRFAKSDGLPRPGNFVLPQFGMRITFRYIDHKNKVLGFFVLRQKTIPEDYVIMQAIHKPWINFLWLGTFILVAGFLLAIVRRRKEAAGSK